jgi:hypothetical protein
VGGATARGGAGGVGGAICPPPAASFGCAPTYDQQALVTICLSSGRITMGRCGSGWAWRCSSLYSLDCVYDPAKNLLAAQWCDDAPTKFEGCSENTGILNTCIQSTGFTTDAGFVCDVYHLPDGASDAGSDGSI